MSLLNYIHRSEAKIDASSVVEELHIKIATPTDVHMARHI